MFSMQQRTREQSAFILQLSGNSETMEISSTLVQNHISLPLLSPKLVILGGLDSSNSEFILKNHLTLLFKRFVYRSRVNTSSFNFSAFKYHIRYVFKIEQKIAREKGRFNVHFDKWEPINDLVSNVN